MTMPSRIATVSPPTATTRLMNVCSERPRVGAVQARSSTVGAPHVAGTPSAPAGGWNTMIWPTFGSDPSRWPMRCTSTRSPMSSVGSIEPLGMRYGLTA
jgi:hypothetical protein